MCRKTVQTQCYLRATDMNSYAPIPPHLTSCQLNLPEQLLVTGSLLFKKLGFGIRYLALWRESGMTLGIGIEAI